MHYSFKKHTFSLILFMVLMSMTQAQTKMPEVLKESQISNSCKSIIIKLADRLIGPKRHHVLKNNSTEKTC